jgi:hypothetical protein
LFFWISALIGYLRARPVTHLVLACLFVALAGAFHIFAQTTAAERDAARAAPQPPAVSLNDFARADDIHAESEVHVIGQINAEYNYRLIERGGSSTDTRFMYVLVGPQDAADTKVVRAAVILREDEIDPFLAMIAETAIAPSALGGTFAVSGAANSTPHHHELAIQAMAREKLTRAPDFIFIEPWLQGRDVALAPLDQEVAQILTTIIAAPALLSLLLAAVGWRFPRAAAPLRNAPGGQHLATPLPLARAQIASAISVQAPLPRNERLRSFIRKSPVKALVLPTLGLILLASPGHFFIAVVLSSVVLIRFGVQRTMELPVACAEWLLDAVVAQQAKRATAAVVAPAPAQPLAKAMPSPIQSPTRLRDLWSKRVM